MDRLNTSQSQDYLLGHLNIASSLFLAIYPERLNVSWEWIEKHPASAIELLFTAVLAWTAVISVRLSTRLARSELDPAVTVTLELDPDRMWIIYLVIKNQGRGSARNVQFTTESDSPLSPEYPTDKLSRMAIFRTGLPFLGPQQEIRSALGTYISMSKDPKVVQVTYETEEHHRWRRPRRQSASFILDVSQFEGISRIGENPVDVISKSLKQMADDLRDIKRGGSWSNVTVTVKRRYFMTRTINQFVRRWFGGQYINSDQRPWTFFRNEIHRSFREKLNALSSKRQSK